MLYIHYSLRFQKNTVVFRALIDLGSKINAMTPVYAFKLALKMYYTNVGAQKIDDSSFKIFEIVLISF